ncbi:MAG: hypothetical protein ACRCXZ_01845, partial [Patescibacteria group bacterium]
SIQDHEEYIKYDTIALPYVVSSVEVEKLNFQYSSGTVEVTQTSNEGNENTKISRSVCKPDSEISGILYKGPKNAPNNVLIKIGSFDQNTAIVFELKKGEQAYLSLKARTKK